jgi:hypothetical protein
MDKKRMGRDPLEGVIDAMTGKAGGEAPEKEKGAPARKGGGLIPKSKKQAARASQGEHEAKTFLLRPDQVDRLTAAARKERVTLSRLMRDLLDGKIKI